MGYPRIRPYKTYAVDDEGARVRVDTHELVLERPVGVVDDRREARRFGEVER